MMDFLFSFLVNLLFRYRLLILALVALVLHWVFQVPIVLFYILLGIYVLAALFVTVLLCALAERTPDTSSKKNVNPYSVSTRDFLKR